MSYINEFPHGRTWDSDLRQILEMYNTVKGLPNNWQEFSEEMNNDWTNLHDFVNNYFTNLDVQDEVNQKIDSLVENGTIKALLEELLTYVTPQMYGAKADGVTDDTEAIRSAIASGKNVFFPIGEYIVSETITINNGITLRGIKAESIIKYVGSDYLFLITTWVDNKPTLTELTFVGGENSFIKCEYEIWGSSFTLENFVVKNFKNDIFNLISSAGIYVANGLVLNCGRVVFDFIGEEPTVNNFTNINSFDSVFFDKYVTTNYDTLFVMSHVEGVLFTNCTFEGYNECMELRHDSKAIVCNKCWFEKINTVVNGDAKRVKFNDCRFEPTVVEIGKDAIYDLRSVNSVYYKGDEENTLTEIYNLEEYDLLTKYVVNNNDRNTPYNKIYSLTTHGARYLVPVNNWRYDFDNQNTFTQSLDGIFRWHTGLMAKLNVDAIVRYGDGSTYAYSMPIFVNNTKYRMGAIEKTELSGWDGDDGLIGTTTFDISGSSITFESSKDVIKVALNITYNILGKSIVM